MDCDSSALVRTLQICRSYYVLLSKLQMTPDESVKAAVDTFVASGAASRGRVCH